MTGEPLDTGEVEALRRQTPGVDHVVHLNHAGSSLPSAAVLDRQIEHLRREALTGGYEAANEAAAEDAQVYDSIARLLNADRSEIARVEHATAGWNALFWSVPMREGQRIVTARAAYGANAVAFLRASERRGVRIDVVPADEHGQVDVDELERRIDDDVALVALTHVPTNGGLVNPAAAVGRIANAAGVPYLLDACQSTGQLVVDVSEVGCDLLSSTGRKYLRGPRGTGFVFASNRIIDRLLPDHPDHHGADWVAADRYELRPDARRYEYWEYNHAGWLALGLAVEEAMAIGMPRIEATVQVRADELRTRLADRGHRVMDLGTERCGIVTVAADGFDAATMKTALRAAGINISVTTPASTRFDAEVRDLDDMLRISVHYLTTSDELERTLDAIDANR